MATSTQLIDTPTSRRKFVGVALGLATLGSGRGSQAFYEAAADKDNWIKSPKNPMMSLGPASAFDSENIMAPAVVKERGQYYMFYAGGPYGPRTGDDYIRYQLGLALSVDGEIWTKTGRPLLPLGERDDFHCTPALLRNPQGDLCLRDGLWHLVFCGNRADDVEYATSRDGLTWEKSPQSPVYRSAYAPCIVQVDDDVRMYYVHKPLRKDGKARSWEIHLAVGPSIQQLRAYDGNPVLTISQPWEQGNLFYPYVLKEADTWVMFYAAYWSEHPKTGASATAIGMAKSSDGCIWRKVDANPVLTPTWGSSYDSVYTSAQSIIHDGDHYKMYYGGRVDHIHKYYAIGLATKHGRLAD